MSKKTLDYYTLYDLRRFYSFKLEDKKITKVNSKTLKKELNTQIKNLEIGISNIDFYLSELIRLNNKTSKDYMRYTKLYKDKEQEMLNDIMNELEEETK